MEETTMPQGKYTLEIVDIIKDNLSNNELTNLLSNYHENKQLFPKDRTLPPAF